jgi:hypothetical protein
MLTWILKKLSWKSFGIGFSAAVVGSYVARPVLVTMLKSGMAAQTVAANTWQQVRAETARVRAEADGPVKLLAEVRHLRDDLAFLKSKFGVGDGAQS